MAITIPQSDRFVTYDATAGQTTFAYNFSIYDQDDLTVYQVVAGVITELTVVTDYTVTGVGNETGGNIELVVAAALDDEIVILGATPELRSTNYSQAGDFRKESVNTEFNKQIQIDQQLRRDVDRSIHLDPADSSEVSGVSAVNMKLPLTEERLGKYLFFNSTDGGVAVSDAAGIDGPDDSIDSEVALFSGTTGQILKRPGNEYMILPQGTTAQRGTPSSIVLRGNNEGSDDVEVYVNGGWTSVLTGGTGAPISATYITQTPNGTLTNEQAMSTLATGIVKNTTATGVQSIAVDGTDYISSLSADITPQLGGDLDVSTYSIVSTGNGDITIDPDGTGVTNITSPLVLDSQADSGNVDGKLYYDSDSDSLSFYNSAGVNVKLGEQNLIRVYNNSGSTIGVRSTVYATGQEATENRMTIGLASASNISTSNVIGMTVQSIANNSFGYVLSLGNISGFNTSSASIGDKVWLSTTAGNTTTSKPLANQEVFIGYISFVDTTNGSIFINVQNNITSFSAADKYWYGGTSGKKTEGDITAFARTILDDADAATARATLGLGAGDNISFLNGDFTGTESLKIPVGTTAERPTVPTDGDFRINTTDGATEIYRNSAWINLEAAGAGLTAASQTEMEAGLSTAVATTPGRQQYHQSSSKAWVTYSSVGGAATLNASYNVASLTYNGTGDVTINIATDFSSANYSYSGISGRNEGSPNICVNNTGANPTVGALRIVTLNTSGTPGHANFTSITMFGDQ